MLSFIYGPTLTSVHDSGKNHSLAKWIFVSKVMSLLFNMSRFVIAFLPRSNCFSISWLYSPSAVILKPKKIKFLTVSIVSYLFAMKWWDGIFPWASLVAQLIKNLPAMQETWVRSLGWEDPLEKGKATHSNIVAWRIPCVTKSQTQLGNFHFDMSSWWDWMPWS